MTLLVYLSLLLALGVFAQWVAWRTKLPSILLLLILGFGLSHVTGVKIDDFLQGEGTLLSLVGFFVAIILFEGGLTLRFSELKEAGRPIARLCTVGVLIAFGLTAVLIHWIGYDWQIAFLLGAILVVTGPTVVAPLLRVIQPSRKVASMVKWEGIVVDPIGAILAVLVFQVILTGSLHESWGEIISALVKTLLIGGVFALILAKIIEFLLKKHLIPDFLEVVFFLAIVAVAFAGSNALQEESGLLTVTVLGIALANQKQVSMRHILEFKENLRVLIISLLFLMLSGRIELVLLQEIWLKGLLLVLGLILVVRPASVLLSNCFSKKTTIRERIFLSLLAPRGIVAAAVTSVFALEIQHATHGAGALSHQADEMVPLVFLVILGTVTFYGLIAAPLARRLGIATKNPDGILFAGADHWVRAIAKVLHDDGHAVLMLDTRYQNVSAARLDGIQAIRANILSEYAEEELDFSGLGHLVAVTPNDEINSLAAREFTHRFGKAKVWQISPADREEHHSKAVASHMRGRLCFENSPSFSHVASFFGQGAVIKKTQLTDVFTLEDFRQVHGKEALILFLHDHEKGLRPFESGSSKVPVNTTLYALVSERSEDS